MTGLLLVDGTVTIDGVVVTGFVAPGMVVTGLKTGVAVESYSWRFRTSCFIWDEETCSLCLKLLQPDERIDRKNKMNLLAADPSIIEFESELG